jgi:hypothetical protein
VAFLYLAVFWVPHEMIQRYEEISVAVLAVFSLPAECRL